MYGLQHISGYHANSSRSPRLSPLRFSPSESLTDPSLNELSSATPGRSDISDIFDKELNNIESMVQSTIHDIGSLEQSHVQRPPTYQGEAIQHLAKTIEQIPAQLRTPLQTLFYQMIELQLEFYIMDEMGEQVALLPCTQVGLAASDQAMFRDTFSEAWAPTFGTLIQDQPVILGDVSIRTHRFELNLDLVRELQRYMYPHFHQLPRASIISQGVIDDIEPITPLDDPSLLLPRTIASANSPMMHASSMAMPSSRLPMPSPILDTTPPPAYTPLASSASVVDIQDPRLANFSAPSVPIQAALQPTPWHSTDTSVTIKSSRYADAVLFNITGKKLRTSILEKLKKQNDPNNEFTKLIKDLIGIRCWFFKEPNNLDYIFITYDRQDFITEKNKKKFDAFFESPDNMTQYGYFLSDICIKIKGSRKVHDLFILNRSYSATFKTIMNNLIDTVPKMSIHSFSDKIWNHPNVQAYVHNGSTYAHFELLNTDDPNPAKRARQATTQPLAEGLGSVE